MKSKGFPIRKPAQGIIEKDIQYSGVEDLFGRGFKWIRTGLSRGSKESERRMEISERMR